MHQTRLIRLETPVWTNDLNFLSWSSTNRSIETKVTKMMDEITRLKSTTEHLNRRCDSLQAQLRMVHSDRWGECWLTIFLRLKVNITYQLTGSHPKRHWQNVWLFHFANRARDMSESSSLSGSPPSSVDNRPPAPLPRMLSVRIQWVWCSEIGVGGGEQI